MPDQPSLPGFDAAPQRLTDRLFVQVHSLIGHNRHVPLARWPLRG